jgi:hypothetical protein
LSGGYNAWNNLVLQSGGGNVGIGTTNPYARLHVTGGSIGQSTTDFAANSAGTVVFMRTGASTGNTYGLIQAANTGDTVGTNLVLNQFGGNVGIGTESPSEKLTIQNGRIYANISGSDRPAIFESDTTRSTLVLRNSTANTNEVRVGSDGYNLVLIANTEGLRLTPTGNVGIGTTSPNAIVHIYSSNTISALLKLETPGNSLNTAFWMEDHDTNVAAKAVATMDLSTGLGLFNLFAGAYTTAGANYYGSTRGASRIGMHDNVINFYTANGINGGQSTGSAVTWYQTVSMSNTSFMVYTNNSTERLRVDANGNVGIGTSSPQSKLEVATSSGDFSHFGATSTTNGQFTGITLGYRENNSSYRKAAIVQEQIGDNSARGHLHLLVDIANDGGSAVLGDSKLMIHGTTGNVGIGTTNPGVKLDVSGSSTVARFQSSTGYSDINFINSTSSAGYFQYNGNDFRIYANSGSTPTMSITGGAPGNVGIGNTNPQGALHVTTSSGYNLYLDKSGGASIQFSRSGTLGYQIDDSSGTIRFLSSGSTPRAVIDSSGNFGIGITNPSSYGGLVVSGTGYVSHINATSGAVGFGLYESGTGRFYIKTLNGSDGLAFIDGDGTSERARFTSDGHFRPATDNTYNLGATDYRWANIYTADLNLSNRDSQNDVDGTWGEWTIQEGEEDLFLLNRRNGKKYKFLLKEIE